jgi:hypothetical protein
MSDPLTPATRQRRMERIEQHVTVSMQDERLSEAQLLDRVRLFNSLEEPRLPESDLEQVARHLAERLSIDVDLGTVIKAKDHEPWLADRLRGRELERWLAYKQLLIQQGRPLRVVDKLDTLTNEILDLAGDPAREGVWKRRGLVLGDVQSGKTGTYLGLFNKASDLGFRLFILLAGNTEVLRQQTQARVDEAFIGRDSSLQVPRSGAKVTKNKLIGVGRIRKDLAHTVGMTTALRDFRRSSYEATNITIQTNAVHPYIFVVKKNKAILKALKAWLDEQAEPYGGHLNVPVLVLDDESDYASVNTHVADGDPTAINQAIRDVLGVFTRSSYVAFTATPFANIFIDHGVENDLFPRNFVYSLDSPTNYVGSLGTFGSSDDVRNHGLHELDDVEPIVPLGHKSHLGVTAIPATLVDAVDTFLLSNAIRDLRGDITTPRSMLVNVSRFKRVQAQVHGLVEETFLRRKAAVELHYSSTDSSHAVVKRLRDLFDREYLNAGFAWPQVLAQLPSSIADIRVLLFNSDTDKKLSQEDGGWDRPRRMIAVGGDVLSRGLTLEGLCVSYFYRRVAASDTLMQMARWFGYRERYEDLCRLWINTESADNYRFAADSIEELRTDLRLMLRQDLTPEDFGLAVRKHPGALLITARNKMRSAQSVTRRIGLAGRRIESTTLKADQSGLGEDLTAFVATVDKAATYASTNTGWHRWCKVENGLIADFLQTYAGYAPTSDPFFGGSALSSWVRANRAARFAVWDLVIAQGRPGSPIELFGDYRQLLSRRRLVEQEGQPLLRVSGRSLRLAGPTDLRGLLSTDAIELAEVDGRGRSNDERRYYPLLERPALIVYTLVPSRRPDDARGSEASDEQYAVGSHNYHTALKVAIPGDPTDVNNRDSEVEYVINTVAQEMWLADFHGDDDDDIDG